jgi:hypothetical protein
MSTHTDASGAACARTVEIACTDTDIVPVFKRGQCVRFKSERVAEMRKAVDKIPNAIGPFPFGKLIIVSCDGNCGNDILYNYEYGVYGYHEGFAVGKDLEPYT